jgi:hypothetical protein
VPLRTNWVKGETVTAADINALAEAANTGGLSDAGIAALVEDPTSETKATLDTTYAPRPAAPGTDGQVLVKAGEGTAWADAPTGGGTSGGGVFTDTDGTPYFDTSTSGGTSIATDTDGVPYFV